MKRRNSKSQATLQRCNYSSGSTVVLS